MIIDSLIRCLVSLKEKQVKKEKLRLKLEKALISKINKVEKVLK